MAAGELAGDGGDNEDDIDQEVWGSAFSTAGDDHFSRLGNCCHWQCRWHPSVHAVDVLQDMLVQRAEAGKSRDSQAVDGCTRILVS